MWSYKKTSVAKTIAASPFAARIGKAGSAKSNMSNATSDSCITVLCILKGIGPRHYVTDGQVSPKALTFQLLSCSLSDVRKYHCSICPLDHSNLMLRHWGIHWSDASMQLFLRAGMTLYETLLYSPSLSKCFLLRSWDILYAMLVRSCFYTEGSGPADVNRVISCEWSIFDWIIHSQHRVMWTTFSCLLVL